MAYKTRLSTKGQIVIPRELRAAHRWAPGTIFDIREERGAVLLRPKPRAGAFTWKDLVGCIAYRGRRKTIRDMDEAVAAEARTRR